jgi:hypothetical protein
MIRCRIVLGMVAMLLASLASAAADDSNVSQVKFLVLRDFNGKPVRNASIVLHPVDNEGKQKRTGQQLKTNADGRTEYPGIPYGKVRVQVIAPYFQTFGQDYDINRPEMEIVIKLKRPQDQHSIYKETKKETSN